MHTVYLIAGLADNNKSSTVLEAVLPINLPSSVETTQTCLATAVLMSQSSACSSLPVHQRYSPKKKDKRRSAERMNKE